MSIAENLWGKSEPLSPILRVNLGKPLSDGELRAGRLTDCRPRWLKWLSARWLPPVVALSGLALAARGDAAFFGYQAPPETPVQPPQTEIMTPGGVTETLNGCDGGQPEPICPDRWVPLGCASWGEESCNDDFGCSVMVVQNAEGEFCVLQGPPGACDQ